MKYLSFSARFTTLISLLLFSSIWAFEWWSAPDALTKGAGEVSVNQLNNQFRNSNQYFKALSALQAYETEDPGEEWLRKQFAINYASFLGDNDIYREYMTWWERCPNCSADEEALVRNTPHQGLEAVTNYVLKHAEDQAVIMFNESHFYPSHRLLLRKLLPALKEAGFTHLAMEALSDAGAKALNKGKAVNFATGYYTREQEYQRLLREAQLLGFELVAYDAGGANREQLQARNIYDRTIGKSPEARVVVFAGYAHIEEVPTKKGKELMAYVFRKEYQIDPVTFSQTAMYRFRSKVEGVCALDAKLLDRDRVPVDHVLINNLPIREVTGKYSITNQYEETVQLALFDKKTFNEKKPFSNLPVRSALLAPGETFYMDLDFKRMQVLMIDRDGKIVD